MTEARVSYLRGFTAQDYYESAPGLFLGDVTSGFLLSVLVRWPDPGILDNLNQLDNEFGFVVGNWLPDPAVDGNGNGWYLDYSIEGQGAIGIDFRWGDALNVERLASIGASGSATGVWNRRTMLIHVAFGLQAATYGVKANGSVLFWVNGDMVGGSAIGATGYTPAPGTNPLRVGFGQLRTGGQTVGFPATSLEFGGFSFLDGLPGTQLDTDDTTLAACQNIVDEHWTSVLDALSNQDDGDATGPLWDTRRGAPNPPDVWSSSQGTALDLARIGSASLNTRAAQPNFYGGFFV